MKLYTYFRSSAAFRVRIALNLKGLAAEQAFVHLRRGDQFAPAYAERNPQRLVPTLEVDGIALRQSLAIVEYLDEIHPLPALLPRAPIDRAWVRSVALAIACDIHPLNNLRVLNRLRDKHGQSSAAVDDWYRHWIAEGMTALEAILAARPRTMPFCHGDAPSLADICLVPQVYNAQRFHCPMADYPTVMAIHEHCRTLPAFAAAFPERQPDAE